MPMVIVQGELTFSPKDRDRFLEGAADVMRSARREEGCLEYVISADQTDPGRVVISERWTSREHLDRHLQRLGEHQTQEATKADPGPKALGREVTVYEVVNSRTLG